MMLGPLMGVAVQPKMVYAPVSVSPVPSPLFSQLAKRIESAMLRNYMNCQLPVVTT